MYSNSYGECFRITTFGESHGAAVGVIIDGCPSGLELNNDDIQKELDRRKPGQSKVSTLRKEDDMVEILSGVFEGKTTGTPIALIVKNMSQRSQDYNEIKDLFRPGHADFTYFKKFGIRDYRGGGRASARETIGRVAAGAVAKKILALKGIDIFGFIVQIENVKAENFDKEFIEQNPVRTADRQAYPLMEEAILKAKKELDSVGGVVELCIKNIPAGIGEPVFDRLDDYLNMLEEAKKRDHRRLGKQLKLFTIEEDAGAGFPIYLPRGGMLRAVLEQFEREEHIKRGYDIVYGPTILKKDLWVCSGHYDNYKENMYFASR